MLEALQRAAYRARVYRFVSLPDYVRTLGPMVDAQGVEELVVLLRESGLGQDARELISSPFKPKPPHGRYQGRFSDGSVGVFYGALERETAQEEVTSFCVRVIFAGQDEGTRAFYQFAECDFAGDVKDLRLDGVQWQFLCSADEGVYPICQAIGREAVDEGLDGLVTRSARRAAGTNAPVFRESALANPQLNEYWCITRDAEDGMVTAAPLKE